jgi:hypothetical protein
MSGFNQLADLLAGVANPGQLPTSAVVNSLNADGTVNLVYLGGLANNISVVSSYTPSSGDIVRVMRTGPATLLVLGTVRTANVTAGTVASDLVINYNVAPVPTTTGGGGTVTGQSGTTTVRPTVTGSYRKGDGWGSRDFLGQGYYPSSSWLGSYRGAAFYGTNAFTFLKGRTVTRIRIYLKRETGAGVFAGQRSYIYKHKNATRPSAAPYFLGTAIAKPSLAVGDSGVFDLPVSVGAELASGYTKGFGLVHDGTSEYLHLLGLGSYSDSFRLDISWTE